MLGTELVAIIGNKGSGKSAVADIIGLLGNSHNQRIAGRSEELFSFLTKEKFRKNKCASNFRAELRWHDGEADKKNLDSDVSETLPEKVEYLPQKYLERICADIADDDFRSTLNEVIFGYVKQEDRYGKQNFNELISYLTQQASEDIKARKRDLHTANEAIVAIEKKLTGDYRKELQGKIDVKKQDLQAHRDAKPKEKPKPDIDSPTAAADIADVEKLTGEIESLQIMEAERRQEQIGIKKSLGDLKRVRQEIQRAALALTNLKKPHDAILADADLSFDQIVTLTVDYDGIDRVIESKELRSGEIAMLTASRQDIEASIEAPADREAAVAASLACQRETLEQQKTALMERLGAPEREYREYLDAMAAWNAQEAVLLGNDSVPAPDSLKGLQLELDKVTTAYPQHLTAAKASRDTISKDIFTRMLELTSFYDSVKTSIDAEISKHKNDLDDYNIAIEAGLRFDPAFYNAFFRYVSQNVRGTYYGSELGRTALKNVCDAVSNWEDAGDVFRALNDIVDALHFDRREEFKAGNVETDVFKQVKNEQTLTELYDFLFGFGYLNTKYDLMVDGKDLSELSPGERGGLLLIFYLMLDKRDIPLVIDQPEDNLDNESVYQILAAFLKKAKKRRQIIMVTHNPNLAVGADAEQIIRVSIDKKLARNDFSFYSGSIENPRLNTAVVDILEGTLPAFDKRRLKYRKPQSK